MKAQNHLGGRKMNKRSRWFFLFPSVVLLIIGLGGTNGFAQPKRGGTLVMGFISEPAVLDSCHGAWNVATMAGQLQNGILETNEKMKTAPGLAESWSVDYKNKKYIFNIRKGVKWHDGKPFTVEDVKFSFEYMLPKYDNRGIYLKDTKVNILSDTRVEVIPGSWAPGIQLDRMASVDWALYPKHVLEGVDFLKSNFRRGPSAPGPSRLRSG